MNEVYYILLKNEEEKIDFSEVYESSLETLVTDVSSSYVFVQCRAYSSSFLNNLDVKYGPYNKEQLLEIVSTSIWNVI